MRIGVRELRQHASRYLALVQRGEVIEVTDRGRLVARLVPAQIDDAWQQLVASGGVALADADADLLDIKPLDAGPSPSAELAALRADER
jgi:prevent-host-death family protein